MKAMKKILIILLGIGMINDINAGVVVTAAAISAANSASRHSQHESQIKQSQQTIKLQQLNQPNKIATGVFVCDAHKAKTKGYYGRQIDKCNFWNKGQEYFSLTLPETFKRYLDGKTIVNVFYDRYDKEFLIYYHD